MKRFEIYIYAAIILALNLPLATGRIFGSMIFLPDNVMGGQLWRIITHPFVHVSWYHLLLDGVAFFILYTQLSEQSRPRRTVYVASCGLTSMIAAWIALPASGALGYCGLSGIGHGLMAVCALEMIAGPSGDRTVKLAGMISLGLLAGKCIIEAVTGKMVFDFMHPGLIGSPIALSHLGGLMGGCLTFLVFWYWRRVPKALRV